MAGSQELSDTAGFSTIMFRQAREQFSDARAAASSGISAYEEYGNTAYVTFDAFEDLYNSPDYYNDDIQLALNDLDPETGKVRPVKVLNLFAYTGGATLSAAAAGAQVTHVDASKGMVAWAKENAMSSGLEKHPIRWLVDDCGKFVEREARRGHFYDGIIMDPPSYGRGPKGEIWKIEENIYPFIESCTKIFADKPLFFLVNSYTTGLAPSVLTYMLSTALKKWNGKVEASEIGLPVRSTGLVLPCGATGRWYRG
jgi:23S rRNA (cytosine1962-C5)-methyltransferase